MELLYLNAMWGTVRGNIAYLIQCGCDPGGVQLAMERRAKQLCAQMGLTDPAGGKKLMLDIDTLTVPVWQRSKGV